MHFEPPRGEETSSGCFDSPKGGEYKPTQNKSVFIRAIRGQKMCGVLSGRTQCVPTSEIIIPKSELKKTSEFRIPNSEFKKKSYICISY